MLMGDDSGPRYMEVLTVLIHFFLQIECISKIKVIKKREMGI